MLEKDKMLAGELYDVNYNKDLEKEREQEKDLCDTNDMRNMRESGGFQIEIPAPSISMH